MIDVFEKKIPARFWYPMVVIIGNISNITKIYQDIVAVMENNNLQIIEMYGVNLFKNMLKFEFVCQQNKFIVLEYSDDTYTTCLQRSYYDENIPF